MEALCVYSQGMREVGDGAFVTELQRCLLAVGAAIEREDTARALDLLVALGSALNATR